MRPVMEVVCSGDDLENAGNVCSAKHSDQSDLDSQVNAMQLRKSSHDNGRQTGSLIRCRCYQAAAAYGHQEAQRRRDGGTGELRTW